MIFTYCPTDNIGMTGIETKLLVYYKKVAPVNIP
jgi:hypothetical protein